LVIVDGGVVHWECQEGSHCSGEVFLSTTFFINYSVLHELSIANSRQYRIYKKTHMNSKISHQSNENFALQTQFSFDCSIVERFQNFHDKLLHLAFSSFKW